MPGPFSSTDVADLRQAERDVRDALGELPLDFRALLAVSNIFRAATAVRNHMAGTVLASEQLSWSAFVVLFVLRVWGPQESHNLAKEAGITGGTLTGVMKTLEERDLARRTAHATDGRRVLVTSTPKGRRVIDRIMVRFNEHEALVTQDLTDSESDRLALILRKVLRTLDALDRNGPDG